MAVIMSLVPTSTAVPMPSGVPLPSSTSASPAFIISAAALRRQDGGTNIPIVTSICGYAVAQDASLKSIMAPNGMVCAMDPPNQLFGFCPRQFSIKNERDIVTNCEWNAWCIDAYDCSDGCGAESARSQFGTTRCNAASRPFCQLTRLGKTHTDETDAYWSVGCGSNHYKIHDYLLDQKAALAPSTPASTTEDDNFTAPQTVQAPLATTSSSQPVTPTSSGPPLALLTANFSSRSSSSGASASAIPSTSSSTTSPAPQPFYTLTYTSADDKEEEAQKKGTARPAILGSAIGSLAIIYILLFTWWHRGPRRRKRERQREAKEAAERVVREQGLLRLRNEFKASGPDGIGFEDSLHKPQVIYVPQQQQQQQEIHELGFGTMTNPKTPRLPEMSNDPPTPKELDREKRKCWQFIPPVKSHQYQYQYHQ
ncbi:hypothetical protein SMACR_02494 [Sordaria macrospora]|uniref:WGS project CABT00000000 data, contig 2.3 n=2 Tax=Sordaria macrospora TaxID=5147 RepID=F7VPR3_SORMK|nr:uncharacterized protein SMAC_02494 [Sordaria macrospora k-hell]KAA8629738.1 hypothetical protein SMACR_02494 [Sordaria macrospora]KAH7627069.1 hypothetical protein B0T09DRAFT_360187 [Sordaria sp. MPI-SDFR-AT-0083]WPJ64884.1 hypothetical protein SMAC4_02494 [Sordaria macrospora]CCC07491.1 unnamed protein product [Sordaria macrospora k-hell]